NAVEAARFALWRDDPALEPVIDPRWRNPRAWTDFRVKMVIFPALVQRPTPAAAKLCRDYLALSDEDARKIGPPPFEEAGRALLDCLARAGEGWARAALGQGAPHALAYLTVPDQVPLFVAGEGGYHTY